MYIQFTKITVALIVVCGTQWIMNIHTTKCKKKKKKKIWKEMSQAWTHWLIYP